MDMLTTVSQAQIVKQLKSGYKPYLFLITALGVSFVIMGLFQFASQPKRHYLFMLIVLATGAELAAPLLSSINHKNKIGYEVGTAVCLAAVPFFGAAVGSLVIGTSGFLYWISKNHGVPLKERNWTQLGFNIGNRSVAIFLAGSFLIYGLESNVANSVLLTILVWLATAVILDQINLWLLIILFRLMKGVTFKPIPFWMENAWAMIVNIGVEAVGGFALATALQQFGSLGIIVFFLPIGLSSVAFQLYVRQMRAHMDNLESIIEERTQELADHMKEKDALLAVLTHDMKTPLTSINLYASLILKKPELADQKPRMVESILRGQKTLTNIVNNILDIEKLQTNGSLPMKIEPLDINALLSSNIETLQAQAMQKDIQLLYGEPMNEIRIKGDQSHMERVFQNIISNAIKYSPEGGTVQISLTEDEEDVYLEVADTGYGIPEEDLPFIFERFRRVSKHKDKASGTGLGLAITKALVEAHDGHIGVTSKEGEGTTFTVTLPLAKRSRVVG